VHIESIEKKTETAAQCRSYTLAYNRMLARCQTLGIYKNGIEDLQASSSLDNNRSVKRRN